MANKNTTASANETNDPKKVIILNKPFLGGWLDEEGRIGHEIIDFFLTDNGKYYVYNNSRGACPDDIWVERDEYHYGVEKPSDQVYFAKYMVLTSGSHASNKNNDENQSKDEDSSQSTNKQKNPKIFNVLYVIKLKEKIHCFNTSKNKNTGLKAGQEKLKKLIETKGIKYNGTWLYDIYPEDDSLYLTFEADKDSVYKVKDNKIWTFEPTKYNFQRNKGYLKNDVDTIDDYNQLEKRIDKEIDMANDSEKFPDCLLQKITLEDITKSQNNVKYNTEKTFLDLIGFTNEEQAFTNMLYTLLKNNEVFNRFCKECAVGGKTEFIEGDYTVSREKKVSGGRMDISGESKSKRVIIENKIHSGLNGINNEKKISQLSTYYNEWGLIKDEKSPNSTIEPLCFITAPDFRKQELIAEIAKFDPKMSNKYHIITYSKIADFFEENAIEIKNLFKEEGNEWVCTLYYQIVDAFRKWSYPDKQALYKSMFFAATEEAKKRNQENK